MKNKKNMRRFLSGFLAMLTVLSTILSPMLSYAADVVQAPEEPPLYEEIKNELLEQVQRNFRWTPELVSLLRKYEKKQTKYGSFENFYPNVIRFFREYSQKENERLDVLK